MVRKDNEDGTAAAVGPVVGDGPVSADRAHSDVAPKDSSLHESTSVLEDTGSWLEPHLSRGFYDVEINEASPKSGTQRSAPERSAPECSAPAPVLKLIPAGSAGRAPSIHLGPIAVSFPPRTQGALHPLDEVLLDELHRAFSTHAGVEDRLDETKLQAALGLRSPLLAQRLLRVFDRDGDGIVSRGEFLERVRRLMFGSQTDKLLFAFRLHDINGDGKIDRSEILAMIRTSMAEENTLALAQKPEDLAELVMNEADKNGDGHLSYREFEAVINRHPAILEMMTRCEATWIAPGVDLKPRGQEKRSIWMSLRRAFQNRLAAIAVLTVWVTINLLLAGRAVWVYQEQGANAYVLVARACGACINFNGALILVPVMRRLLTRVRASKRLKKLPVDDAIQFHRLVGHTMFGLALLHSVAHLLNYAAGMGIGRGLFATGAGGSGLVLLVVFTTMWVMSLPFVRRTSRFELFYFSHLLYFAWFALCLYHGPVFYLWVTVPLLGFAVEQLLRLSRRGLETQIRGMIALSSGVTRLEIARPPQFEFQAGDYAFLRIPSLASHEWHPFTISSAPEQESLTMHVRSLGNFTRSVRSLSEQRQAAGIGDPFPAYLDGPYGTASGHIFESQVAILVGAGIGVTPFASVLSSLILRARAQRPVPNKVHFYWLNRDPYSFEWFAELLLELESLDIDRIVDVQIYLTDGRGHGTSAALNLARAISHDLGRPDFITGLRAKTNLGRPDWSDELIRLKQLHPTDQLDLFFCGPPGLASGIRRVCEEHDITFRQEHF